MFIGHFAVAFAAKKINPRPSLGTYFVAAQFLDLLWPTLLLLQIEKVRIGSNVPAMPLTFTSYPVSHSLVLVLAWSVLFAAIYYAIKKDFRAAVLLGICVLSHWMIDAIVHVPDLPLYPGHSPLVGLGLWKSVSATLTLETLMFIAGVLLYVTATKALNKAGSVGLFCMVVLLYLIHLSNVFSPPPANVTILALVAHLQWLFVLWAYWVDRNRQSLSGTNSASSKRETSRAATSSDI